MDSLETNTESEFFQAQAHLYNHIFGYINCMALKCAVQLNIPDIIHSHGQGQPITLPCLISNLQVHPTKTVYVKRLVRLLVHDGFLAETKVYEEGEEKEAYTLTPPSKLLIKGKEPGLAPTVLGFTDTGIIGAFDLLGKWFNGEEKTVIENAFGMELWELLKRDAGHKKNFDEAMASDSQMINLALRDCKSVFNGLESLVDVGGGTGTTARIISEAYPSLKCIVFDLPQVVQNLSGNNKNLSYVCGSMFESIPSADAVLLKWVLHNWNDEDSIKILKKCKEAVSNEGAGRKVIIIDAVINEKKNKHEMTATQLVFDILMMGLLNGIERTEQEWENLLHAAGFKDYKITPLFGFRSIIEAYP